MADVVPAAVDLEDAVGDRLVRVERRAVLVTPAGQDLLARAVSGV